MRAITKADEVKDPAEQSNVKAAVDQVVVTPAGTPASNAVATTSKFADLHQHATDYLVPDYYETGGGNIFSQVKVDLNGQFPLLHVSLHKPLLRGRQHLPDRPGGADRAVRRPAADARSATSPSRSTASCSSVTSARCGCRRSSRSSASSILFALCLLEPPLAGAGPPGAGRRAPGRGGAEPPPAPSSASPRRSRSSDDRHPDPGCASPASAALGDARCCSRPAARTASSSTPVVSAAPVASRSCCSRSFFWIFFGALFYMDRVRKKRRAPEE